MKVTLNGVERLENIHDVLYIIDGDHPMKNRSLPHLFIPVITKSDE